jgi:alanine racemase
VLTLEVDAAAWRDHLKSYVAAHPGIVPVAKGNGYGLGISTLTKEAAALGVPTVAVGTYNELFEVADFAGEALVLAPWRPGSPDGAVPRAIHTVSRLADLHAFAASGPRQSVVVEVLTSMRRHGIAPSEIAEAAALLGQVDFRGWALHLPLAGDRLSEARRLADTLVGAARGPLWVSHLEPGNATTLAAETGTDVHLRVGTALWLGARSALKPRSHVLDVHRLSRGDTFGYRQRKARGDGFLLIVGGGTSHGIALEAPTAASTARQRAVALASGGLEATGRSLSPFTIAGKKRWFAEPPHMQCSMIWLPGDVTPPEIGDTVDVDVRYTTTSFDEIIFTE